MFDETNSDVESGGGAQRSRPGQRGVHCQWQGDSSLENLESFSDESGSSNRECDCLSDHVNVQTYSAGVELAVYVQGVGPIL